MNNLTDDDEILPVNLQPSRKNIIEFQLERNNWVDQDNLYQGVPKVMDEVLAVLKISDACLFYFFTKAKIEVIHLAIADISFRQNYDKLGQEFMTNKIGEQWKNKPDPTFQWDFTSVW